MSDIKENIKNIKNNIKKIEENLKLEKNSVKLLAVSKTQSIDNIKEAYNSGQQDFGENYLQEALPKLASFPSPDWHFIGAIQSNKTKDIAQNFDWVHSVDSLKVAKRLSDQRPMCLNPLKVMIQINISEESGKAGLPPEATLKLASEITALPNLWLQGLMVIPALSDFT